MKIGDFFLASAWPRRVRLQSAGPGPWSSQEDTWAGSPAGVCMNELVPQETIQGYSPPTVRQFSVFLENKVGRLLELVGLFDEAPAVHLCAFSVLESSDHAVVRIIPNNADAARALLRQHTLAFSEFDLLIVELAENHNLTSMCLYLLGAELNAIHSL